MTVETLRYYIRCRHSEERRSTVPQHARKWICDYQNFAGDSGGVADTSFETRWSETKEKVWQRLLPSIKLLRKQYGMRNMNLCISSSDFPTSPPKFCVDCVWNVMAHAQKPDFVFQRNGRVPLNWRGRQLSRLLAAELCASAVIMLDTLCCKVVWRVLATTPFAIVPFTSPPVRHRMPSHFNWTLRFYLLTQAT